MVFSKPFAVEDIDQQIRPARDGETEAQRVLLRHFSIFIRSCASKFFLSEEDRQDLRQEGRIALFRAIERHRPARGPFGPYARLVIRRHINRMAGKMIHCHSVEDGRSFPEDTGDMGVIAETRNPETEAMEEENLREIRTRVGENLTPLESDVLTLFLQGLTYREMARRLRRPAKSVDNALRRIRSKVKI